MYETWKSLRDSLGINWRCGRSSYSDSDNSSSGKTKLRIEATGRTHQDLPYFLMNRASIIFYHNFTECKK